MNDIDQAPLLFGKYKGQTPEQVSEHDPGYVVWMFHNVNPSPCSRALSDSCEQEIREDEEESRRSTFRIRRLVRARQVLIHGESNDNS